MAEVPLRSYLHEIEKHIESGRTDQAIAHSRYILQTYPKYVDAYRLLGKAYLENHRYSDASDIFQRVLSSVPEDFISHVGMSIIREDEGNLDEAIWHMERAFESQPSNAAIQDELKRLYGKRDNIEPPKIRLTRGALARLYAKGELYQQAIGEIRAVLGENPDRLDLLALLAEIYFNSNSYVEAADTSIALLRHLPNSLIANRIMVHVLAGTNREMEAKTYQQRLSQLDPYSAFASSDEPNSENAADQSVRIEKLDWKPEQALPKADQPAWAASLGVELGDMDSLGEESLPDWLKGLSTAADGEEPFPPPPPSAFSFGETDKGPYADIEKVPPHPDSETDTEISASLNEKAALPPSSSEEQEIQSEAEIPDWLQSIVSAEKEESKSDLGEGTAPELEKYATQRQEAETSETMEGQAEAAPGEIPDWLADLQKSASVPEPEHGKKTGPETPSEELPEWLIEKAQKTETGTEFDTLSKSFADEREEQAEELPEWLLSEKPYEEVGEKTVLDESGLESKEEVEIPDWLNAIEASKTTSAPEESGTSFQESEWMLDTSAQLEEEDRISEETEGSGEISELPEWLMETELEEDISRAKTPDKEMFDSEIPKWILHSDESATLEEPIEIEEPILGDTQPTHIKQTVQPEPEIFSTDESNLESEADSPEELQIETEEMEDAFAWLKSLENEEIREETGDSLGEGLAVAAEAAFIEDRLSESMDEGDYESDFEAPIEQVKDEALVQEGLETAQESDSHTTLPEGQNEFDSESLGLDKELADQEAAFAWLESLAVQQGADEAQELRPEERRESIPDWTKQDAEVLPVDAIEPAQDIIATEGLSGESDTKPEVAEETAHEPGEVQITSPVSEMNDLVSGEAEAVIDQIEEIQAETEAVISEPDTIVEDLGFEGQITEEETDELSAELEETGEAKVDSMLEEVGREASSADKLSEKDISAAPILSSESALSQSQEPDSTTPDFPPARLDLNEASLSELERIPSIGFVLAQRITDYRDENGPFQMVEDLQNVPGIGAAILEIVRDFLFVKTVELAERQSEKILEISERDKVSGELSEARIELSSGRLAESMHQYARLIQSNQDLKQILRDLEEAASRFPDEIAVWQNLGDVHLRLNQASEALQAYVKAEQLLH